MKRLSLVVVSLLALAVLAGCASNDTTARRSDVADEESARPGRIIVHDIAATPDDIPANAAVAGRYDQRDTPRTAGEIELGRQLGARVADGLDKEILNMGMPAERAGSGPPPQVGDVVIKGEPVSWYREPRPCLWSTTRRANISGWSLSKLARPKGSTAL